MTPNRTLLLALASLLAACGSTPDDPDAAAPDAATPDSGRMDASTPALDAGPGTLASSITQYGITWTFDRAYPTGTFVTGDPWVVGPVTIVSVSPEPTTGRNGSVVDPTGGHQGYDDRGGEYDTGENATFPLTLAPDHSLVSSISKPEGIETINVGALRAQAVLTVVSAPQLPTIFRPAYAGTDKRYHDAAALRDDVLPDLAPPESAPDAAELARMLDRPRIDHLSSWTIQHSCAEENWDNGEDQHACYGREYATVISDAALAVLLETPAQHDLVLALVQLGIDNHGVLRAGGSWPADGGHHSGRKLPIVVAALLLDDCDLLAVGTQYDEAAFGEDGQTYAGTTGTALFGQDCGGGRGTYFEDGCTGGGARDCRDPAGAADGCPDYRDCCTSAYWVGEALAARILRAEAIWDHDPFFAYVDRWMAGEVSTDDGTSSAFVSEMWTTYRDALPAAPRAPRTCE